MSKSSSFFKNFLYLFILSNAGDHHKEDLIMTETFGHFPTYISWLILTINSIAVPNIKLYYISVLMEK